MNQHELHNYLPFNTQYRNKYEDSCPLFYGELAVADSDFRILTARGPTLCEGSRFALTDANKRFLFKTLTESRRVVLRRRSQIVLVSGELLPAGFYILLLPEGERNAVAGAMSYLAEMRDMILTAAARKAAEKCVGDEGFSAAEDEMALLDGVLRPESGLSLAELCERIAFYAGCHIRFDDSLRRVSLPELRSERIRLTLTWTMRSPEGPPLRPVSPCERIAIFCPSSMPAGIVISSFFVTLTKPFPRQ